MSVLFGAMVRLYAGDEEPRWDGFGVWRWGSYPGIGMLLAVLHVRVVGRLRVKIMY